MLSVMAILSPSFTAALAMRSVFSLYLMPSWPGSSSFSTSEFSIVSVSLEPCTLLSFYY